MSTPPFARFGALTGTDLQQVSTDLRELTAGRWAVAVTFEGHAVAARFRTWRHTDPHVRPWSGVGATWHSSLDRPQYTAAVRAAQADIARGWVYQVNLCRVLSVECDAQDLSGLYERLEVMQAPFGGLLALPEHDVHIASASPERFLTRTGSSLISSPIKGTAATPNGFLTKDIAENVMIVDLVRNDVGRIARTGSVRVPDLLSVEPYPGLYHLVSSVTCEVDGDWPAVFEATFPPGSVSGAPKHSALEVISRLEPCPRQWYCGAFGWIDIDAGRAELAVAIRTFWLDGGRLKFGTGAGITWGSDPDGEWDETQLKAQRLIALASGTDMVE